MCDGCKMSPLIGTRNKCTKCSNTDLCSKCVKSLPTCPGCKNDVTFAYFPGQKKIKQHGIKEDAEDVTDLLILVFVLVKMSRHGRKEDAQNAIDSATLASALVKLILIVG